MNEERSYNVFFAKPAVDSKYAFLSMGFKILDAEPTLPLWHPPVEITDGMPTVVKAYYGRWNPALAAYDDGLRSAALKQLSDVGLSRGRLTAPLSKAVAALVASLMDGERARLALNTLLDRESAGGDRNNVRHNDQCFARDLCARVVVAARLFIGGSGFARTAEFLNEGLSTGVQGITRHHAARAFRADQNRRRRLGRRSKVDLHLINIDVDMLAALDVVYREARTRREFRRLKGEKLALAIHESFDLNEYVHRASKGAARHMQAIRANGEQIPSLVSRAS
jgi:hypothetical protein